MIALLLKNEIFYLSIFSIAVLFHGIDIFFSKRNKTKSAIFYTSLGGVALTTILISTFSQYNSFSNLPFNRYQTNIEKIEVFSINPKVQPHTRLSAAHKAYIDTGEIINYLDASKKLVRYPVSDDDKKQRLKKREEDELIIRSIKENLLICEMIFRTIAISLLFGGALIIVRLNWRRTRQTTRGGPS